MENYGIKKQRCLESIGKRYNCRTRKEAYQSAERACAFGYKPVLDTKGKTWHYHPVRYVVKDGVRTAKVEQTHDHYYFWKRR